MNVLSPTELFTLKWPVVCYVNFRSLTKDKLVNGWYTKMNGSSEKYIISNPKAR